MCRGPKLGLIMGPVPCKIWPGNALERGRLDMKHTGRGFTLLEVLVVIGIMGILMIGAIPSVMNSLETRNLDNSARDIQTTLQQARYKSVDTKINSPGPVRPERWTLVDPPRARNGEQCLGLLPGLPGQEHPAQVHGDDQPPRHGPGPGGRILFGRDRGGVRQPEKHRDPAKPQAQEQAAAGPEDPPGLRRRVHPVRQGGELRLGSKWGETP